MRAVGAPDALVRVEDLTELVQRAIAVIRQAFSFASQHASSHKERRRTPGGGTHMISPTEP